jgi:hypothetical protein
MRTAIRFIVAAIASMTVAFAAASDTGNRMIDNARQFLAGLDNERAERMRFAFDDEERVNWHFIPRAREGLPYGELTPAQRRLADRLLASGLSSDGMSKALGVMYLDQILLEIEGSGRFVRDPDGYFFSLFGEPSDVGTWGWRLEGHHLALNFTVQNGEVVSNSPAFMGTNPAIVTDGPHAGLEVLAPEQTLARDLLQLFDDSQLDTVIFADAALRDIVSGNTLRAEIIEPRGLSMGAMNDRQADALMTLLRVYIDRMHPDLARVEIEKIMAAGLDAITFAWAGSAEPGAAHYYRIQGPTFLVEYDNAQNDANHIHSVWRDFDGDFGADLLGEHYAASH